MRGRPEEHRSVTGVVGQMQPEDRFVQEAITRSGKFKLRIFLNYIMMNRMFIN